MVAGATRIDFAVRRLAVVGLGVAAAVLLALMLAAASASGAHAQEGKRRWFSLRELFAPRHERVAPRAERAPADEPKPRKTRQPKRNKTADAPKEPEVAVKEKAPDARVVLVIGDFLGSALADGLGQAYAENPNIIVVDRTRGSSGFVRDDVFDWPAEARTIVEKEKPAAIVVMLGSNDRQQMRIGDERLQAGSEPWTREYQKRVAALVASLKETAVPFAWVGLPAFKSSRLTDDVLVFNEFYRAATAEAGAQFIDIWDGFVDENGMFASTGPDITGQPVRLRTGDGINFTAAGKRKIAFYAEKPLAKLLGLSEGAAAVAGLPLPEAGIDPRAPVPVDRTLPISLNDPALDGGSELLGAQPRADAADSAWVQTVVIGTADKPAPGRADNFLWPPQAPASATPGPVVQEQAATAASTAAAPSIP